MSVGLLALLDDVAAIAKVSAAYLDDIASQAAKAGVKAAGVVIDDTAVTPGYVIGFAAKRELPIVGKIAAGSLRNKLLILLPAALALSYFASLDDHAASDDRRRLSLLRGRGKSARSGDAASGASARSAARHGRIECGVVGGREGRKRDQDRLHPFGRDHGDHAGGASQREVL